MQHPGPWRTTVLKIAAMPEQVCCAAGDVQTSLQREQVLWKQGLLVTPPIVYDLLNAIMVRTALPAALCRLPIVRDLAYCTFWFDTVHARKTCQGPYRISIRRGAAPSSLSLKV